MPLLQRKNVLYVLRLIQTKTKANFYVPFDTVKVAVLWTADSIAPLHRLLMETDAELTFILRHNSLRSIAIWVLLSWRKTYFQSIQNFRFVKHLLIHKYLLTGGFAF